MVQNKGLSDRVGERILPDQCWVLRAPRLNQNDDAVTLRWLALDRSQVAAGQPVAEIETEKATAELVVGAAGLFLHAVDAGARVAVDAPLAYVGHDPAALARVRDAHATSAARDDGLPT